MTTEGDLTTTEKGQNFEKEVAAIYEALGYKVERNVQVKGHQVDLLATRSLAGARTITYMIDAKNRSSGSVGVNEFATFSTTATRLFLDGAITGAIMVTNADFSQIASGQALDSNNLRLMTINELRNEIFNPSEALTRTIIDYEARDINTEYIALDAESKFGSGHRIKDIGVYICQWVAKRKGMLVVAGDFGSGKTTILERAFYDCAVNYSKGRSDIFPIVLPLRSFHSYDDLWSFVTTKALEKNYISVSRSTLEKRIRQGKIAFFLDGFDEIHTGATAAERASYLARLQPLISSPCPCILTTRPTYFESFNEMHNALSKLLPGEASFDGDSFGELDLEAVLDHLDIHRSRKIDKNDLMNIVLIDVLNRDKVVEYVMGFKDELLASTGQSVEFILEYLYKIYDLKDLLRRPLLLKMIVVLIIKGGLNVNSDTKHVGPATLYSAYTWMCAKRDTRKSEADERSFQLLTDSERLSNCRELALTMLEKGSIELGHTDIVKAVTDFAQAKAKGKKPSERALLLNRIVTDTRVCSFISNTDESTFRFTHKSFFEFFVAHAIIRNLTKYQKFPAVAEQRKLTREIMIFLGSFVRDYPEHISRMELCFRNSNISGATRASLAGICLASGVLLETLQLAATQINDVELKRYIGEYAYFNNVKFSRVDIEDVQATDWQLTSCEATSSSFKACSFRRSKFDLDLTETTLERCGFDVCDVKLSASKSNIDQLSVTGGTILMTQGGHYRDTKFHAIRDVHFAGDAAEFVMDGNSRLSQCQVRSAELRRWYHGRSRISFDDCIFLGLYVDYFDLLKLAGLHQSSKRGPLQLRACSGVIFTDDPSRTLSGEGDGVLKQHLPDIFIADVSLVRIALGEAAGDVKPSPSDLEAAKKLIRDLSLFVSSRPSIAPVENTTLARILKLSR